MKPPPFAYARAATVTDALELLHAAGEDAKLLAGGQSLMPLLAYRLARPTHLVDIGRIPELTGLAATGTTLTIRALTTHATLERSAALAGPWTALRQCAGLIGHLPIRQRGTLGGSLAHADPAAELPVVSVALDAELHLRSLSGERVVMAEDFFAGPFTTCLGPEEILTEARFSIPHGVDRRSRFAEFSTRAGDFAAASVAIALDVGADGYAQHARVVLGSVGTTPRRAPEAEDVVRDSVLDEHTVAAAADAAAEACTWAPDGPDNAAFRRDLVRSLTLDTLTELGASR